MAPISSRKKVFLLARLTALQAGHRWILKYRAKKQKIRKNECFFSGVVKKGFFHNKNAGHGKKLRAKTELRWFAKGFSRRPKDKFISKKHKCGLN